jgi:hypothetical protein
VLAARVDGSATDEALGVVTTRCAVHGDFDARVTYRLPLWPFGNDAAWSLNAPDLGPYGLGRSSRLAYDEYLSYLPPVVTELLTNDLTGTLRLTRRGSRVTALIRLVQRARTADRVLSAAPAASYAASRPRDTAVAWPRLSRISTRWRSIWNCAPRPWR